MLRVEGLSVRYGDFVALAAVDLAVADREIDLARHIVAHRLPEPGGMAELESLIGEIAGTPWTGHCRCGRCMSAKGCRTARSPWS